MQVRVVESRHDEVPTQINDLRLRPFQFLDLYILAHRLDPVAPHPNRLLPQDRTELRGRRHARVNVRADENNVCLLYTSRCV